MQKKFVAMVAGLLFMLPTISFALAGANTVNSAAIIKADGTSGQTLTTGNGIKTGHIQDGAVTGAKIAVGTVVSGNLADGSVSTAKLADGAVTDAKISGTISGSKLGAHSHNGSDIVSGSITGDKLANGTINDAQIGSVSASKLSGTIFPDKLATYVGVKVVHKGAVDLVNTFPTIGTALAAIGRNTTDRYAILIMPGVYEEDFTFLQAPERSPITYNVDLIGASRQATKIKPLGNNYNGTGEPVIPLASGMYLRHLTVEGTVGVSDSNGFGIVDCDVIANKLPGQSVAIAGFRPQLFTIDNVNITTSGQGMWLYELWDWNTQYSAVTIKDINIVMTSAAGQGMWVYTSSMGVVPISLSNIRISGSGAQGSSGIGLFVSGVMNIDMSNIIVDGPTYPLAVGGYDSIIAKINNSSFKGAGQTIVDGGIINGNFSLDMNINNSVLGTVTGLTSSTIKVGNSQINGSVGGGNVKTVNCYDGNFSSIANGTY